MKITVYSKPSCQACDLTKTWLDNNVVTVGSFDDAWTGFELNRLEELL